MIALGEEKTTEQKIWESDIYAYAHIVDFNHQGIFWNGYFANREDARQYYDEYAGIMWIKENGEMEQIISWDDYDNRSVGYYETLGGFYITEDGYYLCNDYLNAVIKYDFEGNKIGGT